VGKVLYILLIGFLSHWNQRWTFAVFPILCHLQEAVAMYISETPSQSKPLVEIPLQMRAVQNALGVLKCKCFPAVGGL